MAWLSEVTENPMISDYTLTMRADLCHTESRDFHFNATRPESDVCVSVMCQGIIQYLQ